MNRSAAPALLLACVTALAAPARAEIKTQWVDYSQGGTALQGYLAYDDAVSGKRPCCCTAAMACRS